jgi:hypothetical protein
MGNYRLLDDLQKAIEGMTPYELAKFRKELRARLPVVIIEAAQAAQAAQAKAPTKTSKAKQAEVIYDG